MAEGEPEITLTLTEKYLLQEKDEQPKQSVIPVEATEIENSTNVDAAAAEVVTEKTDETPAAEESTEAPEQEGSEEQETDDEEKSAVKVQPAARMVIVGACTFPSKIETAPVDFRFPTTNQTRHCFTRYVEYHRCIAAKGEGAPECDKFAKYYRSLCPGEWVERWNEQRENGTFPGPL